MFFFFLTKVKAQSLAKIENRNHTICLHFKLFKLFSENVVNKFIKRVLLNYAVISYIVNIFLYIIILLIEVFFYCFSFDVTTIFALIKS